MSEKLITIGIAAYNDMYSLENLVDSLQQIKIRGFQISFFILDDGSKDNTTSILKNLQKKYQNVTIKIHKQNLGFGRTIKEIVKTPISDYVIFLSGDAQFKNDAVELMIRSIDKHTTYILGVRNKRKDSIRRRLFSRLYNIVISIIFRIKATDINSIFLLKRSLIENTNFNSKSAFIHAEIYLKLLKKSGNDGKCKEVLIPHYPREYGIGSGGKLRTIIPTIMELVLFCFNRNSN